MELKILFSIPMTIFQVFLTIGFYGGVEHFARLHFAIFLKEYGVLKK